MVGIGAADPQKHRQQHQRRHDPFVARQRPHRLEFVRTPFDDFRAFLHLRPADHVTEQRHQDQQQDAERREADEPLRPADVDAGDLLGDGERRGIRRQRGQEQRACHRGGRKRRPHHIGADPAGGRPGFGAVDARNVADDRIDGAAAARGVRRRRRRQHEVGEGNGIAEPDGAAAEAVHQQQSEPPAEPALAVADREHEGADDQPHRAFGKPAQHPAQRLVGVVLDISRDTRDRQADDADGADRHRFQDQSGDHGSKDRKIVPLIGVEAGRNRQQIEREPDRQRRDGLPGDFHASPLFLPVRAQLGPRRRFSRERSIGPLPPAILPP